MTDLTTALYNTAFEAGIPIISGDKCCQLLAWTLVYGGGYEGVVLDRKLHNAILYAQKRLNIVGGGRPGSDLIPAFKKYVMSIFDYNDPPEWVLSLEDEYGIDMKHR